MTEKQALIGQIRGKLQATGVLITATGVILAVSGFWWGPAVLLPGVLLIVMGWLD
jgi:hypothetical protein